MSKPYYQDNFRTVYNKSCTSMDELKDESIQMCVTSPPYWGLRKYAGEQDLIWGGDNHHEHIWCQDIIRKDRGIAKGSTAIVGNQLNEVSGIETNQGNICGRCGAWHGSYGLEPTPELYISHSIEILREIKRVLRKDGVVFWNIGDSYWGGNGHKAGETNPGKEYYTKDTDNYANVSKNKHDSLKPKDLCLIPFHMAIEAQRDGWWVRSVIIWSKNNPMPESVKDRPTESHEYILMLTKSAKYYWDQEAVLEPSTTDLPRTTKNGDGNGVLGSYGHFGNRKMEDADKSIGGNGSGFKGHSGNYDANGELLGNPLGRNLRSVWSFPTHPYKEAHFATFPEELPERCIKAGSKECDIVLDPFAGSGTTLEVATKLGRKSVGYEISTEYCELIIKRNNQHALELI
jgi:DNA modification methylase